MKGNTTCKPEHGYQRTYNERKYNMQTWTWLPENLQSKEIQHANLNMATREPTIKGNATCKPEHDLHNKGNTTCKPEHGYQKTYNERKCNLQTRAWLPENLQWKEIQLANQSMATREPTMKGNTTCKPEHGYQRTYNQKEIQHVNLNMATREPTIKGNATCKPEHDYQITDNERKCHLQTRTWLPENLQWKEMQLANQNMTTREPTMKGNATCKP